MSASYTSSTARSSSAAGFGLRDYVTELQLHMALQARSLTPSLDVSPAQDSPQALVQQAQAELEKSVSRQWL
ncbi:hypothetical protein [Synechococcus sp. H55.11]|uniref:hypothetical protein n=1 Tax=Synechococcus sp. H55.11 TaxID=2967121 RepID=UPI0039C0163A